MTRLFIVGIYFIAIISLIIAIGVVNWSNRKKRKAAEDKALRKEIADNKTDEYGGKHIFALYVPAD